ncbi:MAG: MarR family transcriptional regulator [Eubacteriales bacterium]|nr:MarR family transcriptional regulator [Eubacteriales bacterium]
MIEKNFGRLYNKMKLQLYTRVLQTSEGPDPLNPQEVISMEIIAALHRPTVAEFAHFAHLSAPNAAYRVNRLVKKGYLLRKQSEIDKREYHLKPTKRYLERYGSIYSYITVVSDRIRERFSNEDVEKLDKMIHIIESELMPEANASIRRVQQVPEKQNTLKKTEKLFDEVCEEDRKNNGKQRETM